MKINKIVYYGIIVLFFIACQDKKENSKVSNTPKSDTTIFDKIDSEYSGIFFNNELRENLSTNENLFNYDYFYNGGGVGIEDINNDGLPDVFFCGNQVPNRLYLNLGNFKFKDITETAGVNQDKTWTNGVTFVDINNDGWMDIYLSQGGPGERNKRKNTLLINQKNQTFSNEAKSYGLDDLGISTQTAFFDYDKDGDLDCFVMNENEYYGVDPITMKKLLKKNPKAITFNSSHLYENQNGKFIDVTRRSGLERPIFGLGLVVSDINNDNLLDIYVASDYYIPDALFINKGDGTFTDEIKSFTNQISFYGMGVDIADINNDQLQDIFVLDMASNDHFRAKTLMASMNTARFDFLIKNEGYQYQYMYNSFQVNQGNQTFSNISQLTKTPSTDWSWSVLLSDYDLDKDKDIYITNGYRRYALDNDLQQRVLDAKIKYKGNVPHAVKQELYNSMPSEKLSNIVFTNEQNLNFSQKSTNWGLDDFSFSNGAAEADLDNDGDLDLIVNNIDQNAFVYKNLTRETKKHNYLKIKTKGATSEDFPKITIQYNDQTQFIEKKRVRGYRSAQENKIIFGLKEEMRIDTLTVVWENGKIEKQTDIKANQEIVLDIQNAQYPKDQFINELKLFTKKTNLIDFAHLENSFDDFKEEILLPYRQSTFGPFVSKGDLNGDGLEDIFIGGASGHPAKTYIQTNGALKAMKNPALEKDKTFEDMASLFFDIDNDGDQDIYVVSGGYEFEKGSSYYQDRIYINDGKGNLERAEQSALSNNRFNGKTVAAIDFDSDGDTDIIVGNGAEPKAYPNFERSILYENENGILLDKTDKLFPDLKNFGIVNAIETSDFNGDGKKDIIISGEWTGLGFFKNNGTSFEPYQKTKQLLNEKGWWYTIKEIDINNDGLNDYLFGNVGLNMKFKPSKEKPLKVFAEDFDGNGSNDIVLSKKYQGQFVPVRGRECSSQQMPFIKEKFKTYEAFAQASLVDVYGDNALNSSFSAEANTFSSKLALNKGGGEFIISDLPIEAQMFPLLTVTELDVDNDNIMDYILAGNIYETEVETPRLDAISGLALKGQHKDNTLKLILNEELGIYPNGNIKNALAMKVAEKTHLLFFQNNGSVFAYSKN